MPDQHQILLRTKLHRPRLPNDLVTRTRLIDLLYQDRSRQLILVCAPAGFGKSTLVSNWLRHMAADQPAAAAAIPAAWLSLDDNDSDLTIFLQYFIAALRTIFEGACEETLALLQARQKPPQSVISATLSNELEQIPREFILVLDDYYTIHGTEVHNLLGELVRHWPRPLHLVLISRINPPIQISSLRAKGMISEIRTRDLRFTPEETVVYLRQSQLPLQNPNTLNLLEERFEGWPAGLHLAALSLRSAGSQESVLAALSSENANITSYLVDEVLTRQFPAIYSFLLMTSILDRFCAPLCEAVIGETDPAWTARACLDWIERSELFLIPLDNHGQWYRYHHLFQELLRKRLATEMMPEQVNTLHLRASAWFEAQGLLDEALEYALAADDIELAARQMKSGLHDVIDREDRTTLERWLRLLPEEMIQQSPGLLMIKAWALQHSWKLDLLAQTLMQAEELLSSEIGASLPVNDSQIIRGQILVLRAQWLYFTNATTQVIDLCREALTLLPPTWTFSRGGAMFYLGMAMQASGQELDAEQLLLHEYESYSDKTNSYAQLVLQSLGWNYLKTGQLERTRQIAQVMLQSGAEKIIAINKSIAVLFLGVADYQQNNLKSAEHYFTQIVENRFTAHITAVRDAVAGLALIHQSKREYAAARQMVESISQFDLEQRGSEDIRTSSLRARLRLLQGDLEGARNWVDTLTHPPSDMAILWLEEPQVTRARILLASDADTDLRSALQILDALHEIAERTHNTRYKIEILALRALAMEALGETSAAESILKQAVNLAQPGGFIRVFVDLGKPMQELLRRLTQQGHWMDAMGRILAAFPQDDENLPGDASPARQLSPGISMLAEPLTPRELEVLALLRGPLSIKEIAIQLHITYATAKRHTINIYAKLDVNQRWNAVARAEELNILSPR